MKDEDTKPSEPIKPSKSLKKASSKKSSSIDLSSEIKIPSSMPLEEEMQRTSDGNKIFNKDDLLRYRLSEAQFQNAQTNLALKNTEFESQKAQFELKLRDLIENVKQSRSQYEEKLRALSILRSELEGKYSINFDSMSFHELTGVIFEHVKSADPQKE